MSENAWTDEAGNRHATWDEGSYDAAADQERLDGYEQDRTHREQHSAAWGPRSTASDGQMTALEHLLGRDKPGQEGLEGSAPRGSYRRTYPGQSKMRKAKKRFTDYFADGWF